MHCGVCYKIYAHTRMFPCGHTLCGPCSKRVDDETVRTNAHTAREYKCPFCRETTIRPWYRRPKNHSLESVLEDNAEYVERTAAVQMDVVQAVPIPGGLNVADVCRNARIDLAIATYTKLIPQLLEAAREGCSYVVYREKHIVEDVNKVSDLLAELLFKHDLYKLESRNDEVVVTILPTYLLAAYTNTVGAAEETTDVVPHGDVIRNFVERLRGRTADP